MDQLNIIKKAEEKRFDLLAKNSAAIHELQVSRRKSFTVVDEKIEKEFFEFTKDKMLKLDLERQEIDIEYWQEINKVKF
jgi:hypothetical protein